MSLAAERAERRPMRPCFNCKGFGEGYVEFHSDETGRYSAWECCEECGGCGEEPDEDDNEDEEEG